MQMWSAYRKKRGPLNLGYRLEFLFARLGLQVNRAVGGDIKWDELIRFHDAPEDEPATIEDMMHAIGMKRG